MNMDKRQIFGTLYTLGSELKYFLGFTSYIFISELDVYSRGYFPDYELMKKIDDEAEVLILFPHTTTEVQRTALKRLAKDLGSSRKIVVHEYALELGGGADESVKALTFIYQQFQTLFDFSAVVATGVFSNLIYDVLKKIYARHKNPILKSQFTIRRQVKDKRYNYIFDNLDAETAISAGKMIPSEIKVKTGIKTNDEYYDIFLTYSSDKRVWVQVFPYGQ